MTTERTTEGDRFTKGTTEVKDNFVNHIIQTHVKVALWYLSDRGELELHKASYDKSPQLWYWHTQSRNGSSSSSFSDNQVKIKLKDMVKSYNIPLEEMVKCEYPLLSYGYYDKGNWTALDNYQLPLRNTAFVGSEVDVETIKKISGQMHQQYLNDIKKYNKIVRAVYKEIKIINPDRASKIQLDLNDNPKPIAYVYTLKL